MPYDATDTENRDADRTAEAIRRCLCCRREVTRDRWRITINGTHERVVFNPAGVVYRVVCFREAPGVRAIGAASMEFTWFKGFAWRLVRCLGCNAHLGWRYEGDGPPPVFFGLIAGALTTDGQ